MFISSIIVGVKSSYVHFVQRYSNFFNISRDIDRFNGNNLQFTFHIDCQTVREREKSDEKRMLRRGKKKTQTTHKHIKHLFRWLLALSVNLSIFKIYDSMNFRFSTEFISWASSHMFYGVAWHDVYAGALSALLYQMQTNSTLNTINDIIFMAISSDNS